MNEKSAHQEQVVITQTEIDLIEFLKKNFLAIAVQGVGLLVVLVNLWLATKLFPLAEDIRKVAASEEKLEKRVVKVEDVVVKLPVLEEKVNNISVVLTDVQSDIKTLIRDH